MPNYKCPTCDSEFMAMSHSPKIISNCPKCKKPTEHTKVPGTITANSVKKPFISSFNEIAFDQSTERVVVAVKPEAKPTTQLDVKSGDVKIQASAAKQTIPTSTKK